MGLLQGDNIFSCLIIEHMTLYQQALAGSRRRGATNTNYMGGNKASKFFGSVNINSRKIGVGARHLAGVLEHINDSTNGYLENNVSGFKEGSSLLRTVGRLAKDRDMYDTDMTPAVLKPFGL